MIMKILASDYDGTLRTEELVAEKDIEAIARFRKAGNCLLYTSRCV